MPVVDAYGERRAAEVMQDTWGHLAATPGVRYPGTIIYAEGEFGGDGVVILRAEFQGLSSSPWFYEHVQDWLYERETEPGRLYRFAGYYRVGKNGRARFVGRVREIALPD